jgi:hypothetical protein
MSPLCIESVPFSWIGAKTTGQGATAATGAHLCPGFAPAGPRALYHTPCGRQSTLYRVKSPHWRRGIDPFNL